MRQCHLFSQLNILPYNDKETLQDQNFIKLLSNADILSFLSQNELFLEKNKLKEKIKNLIYFHSNSIKPSENFIFRNKNRIKSTKNTDKQKISLFPLNNLIGAINSDKYNCKLPLENNSSADRKLKQSNSYNNNSTKINKLEKITKITSFKNMSTFSKHFPLLNKNKLSDKFTILNTDTHNITKFNQNIKSRNEYCSNNSLKINKDFNNSNKTIETQLNTVLTKKTGKTDKICFENSINYPKTNENFRSTNPTEIVSVTQKDLEINNKEVYLKISNIAKEDVSEKDILSDKELGELKKHYMKKKKALNVLRSANKLVLIKEKKLDFFEKQSLNKRCHTASEIINLRNNKRLSNLYDTQYKFKSSKQLKIVSSCKKEFKNSKNVFTKNIKKVEKLALNLEENYKKAIEGCSYKLNKSINRIIVENYKKKNSK